MRNFVLAALILFSPNFSHADTETFLQHLREGEKTCYEAYQATSARGDIDWTAYTESVQPAIDKLLDSYAPYSWGEFAIDNKVERNGERVNEMRTLSARKVGNSRDFLNYLSGNRLPSKDLLESEFDVLGKRKTYFVQFLPDERASCKNSFRMSLSLDEELSEQDRYKEIARVLEALLSGESRYRSSLNWLKIETPEYLRADPILLRFCYDDDQEEPDLEQANMIISEVNKKLSEIQFKSSERQYPPAQLRAGYVSVADYTKGYSFGTQMCSYFEHYLDKHGNDHSRATQSFEVFWKKNVGEFEKVLVPDLSDLVDQV